MNGINTIGGKTTMGLTKEKIQPSLHQKTLSDEELVRLFSENREEESFNEIVNRYRDKVYWTALKITNNAGDAEDIVQEVFLSVYRKGKTFRGESRFSTWLHRLAMNEIITRLRQRKREKEVLFSDYMPQFQEDGHHLVPVVDWSQDVDKLVANKEFYRLIQEAMDQLSPVDKAVVVLSELEEMSNPEIGEALGLTVQAVKARLHRARLFLRGKLTVYLGYSPA